MNTYGNRNNCTFYKNPGAAKRNSYQASSKRVYKNLETIKRRDCADSPIDSIIKLFRGTIVTDEIGPIELKAQEVFYSQF